MNRIYPITAVTILALSFVAIGRNHAADLRPAAANTDTTITQIVTGGPSPKQEMELSKLGLMAVEHAQLARLAINDGYVDNAKKLLAESHKLLDQAEKQDRPITVTTKVREGQQVKHEREREKMDLIPIASELQVIEAFDAQPTQGATDEPKSTAAADQPVAAQAKAAGDETAKPQSMVERAKVRDAAIAQAKEHLQRVDRQAAAQSLKLADLTLIAHEISLPLAETSAEVDQAIKLLDAGKPYEANLELKKVRDGLVVTTAVVGGPTDPVSPAGSGSEPADGQS